MADDPLAGELAALRERNEERIRFGAYTEHTVEHHVAEGDVRRLLAALGVVLEMHAPTAYVAYSEPCAAHLFDIFGRLDCKNCRKVKRNGCQTCRDENGRPAKPEDCKERPRILASLTGEGNADG